MMGRVQRSLFPYLDKCFDTLLSEQEQRHGKRAQQGKPAPDVREHRFIY